MEKISELNTFQAKNLTISSKLLIGERFNVALNYKNNPYNFTKIQIYYKN